MQFADGNDFIDIILYIVVIVGGLIASAYRNYAKRKEMDNRKPGEVIPNFPEIEFDTVLEKPVINEPVIIEKPSSENMAETLREIISRLDTPQTTEEVVELDNANISDVPVTEGQAVFQETAKQIISDKIADMNDTQEEYRSLLRDISEDEIKDEQVEEIVAEFDLEEAVIHSEILRTKHFSNSY